MNTTISHGHRVLAALLGSEARARALALLYQEPGTPLLLRDLAQRCGLSVTPVHRQLRKLEQIGLVGSEIIGNARAYHLNADFPGWRALGDFVTAMAGVVPQLRSALADLDIVVAFIYGSLARGDDRLGSDVDLAVIGTVPGRVLAEALAAVEQATGRQISPVHLGPEEVRGRAQDPSAFWDSVMSGPKLFVKGSEDELRGLAGQ
jgi:predicted nucleotidyltransferase